MNQDNFITDVLQSCPDCCIFANITLSDMNRKVRYGVGEQSFEALRERECIYVDKTRFIEKIVESGSKYFFLGRPRRFGKSLFLSTLKSFFQGKRELLKIYMLIRLIGIGNHIRCFISISM